ncbi:B3/4 domain-containing protein, partial [Rhizobiaceae sp. 2RAB30]
MFFHHADDIWGDFPELVPGALRVDGVTRDGAVDAAIDRFSGMAGDRLVSQSEGELPEIQAWRRIFSRMGLKPTQYRCASEALLRRFRQEGSLPCIHPLIDLCNAASLAFAIPIAVFDVAQISGGLQVRRATGGEAYQTFSGGTESPEPGEVIFADEAGRAHARRWT